MFCKICQNFMDITNNIISIEKKQEDEYDDTNGFSNSSGFNSTEGTDTDTINTNINNQLIESILGGKIDYLEESDDEDKEKKIKKLDFEELQKNPHFNKLSNIEKTILVNKINDKFNKEVGKISKSTDSVINKECYFCCKTCGYYEIIPDKMFIFSRGDEKKDDIYNFNFINYKNDPTLPNTKKYTCINEKCSTHKEPKLKNAIFYRQKGSYSTRYICSVCESFWNTFIEK